MASLAPLSIVTAFFVAFAVTVGLTPLAIAGLHRWNMIDVPNHRSSHSRPVPRGGGIGVVVGAVAGASVAAGRTTMLGVLVVGAVVLAAVGLTDDRFDLPAAPRLAIQLIVPFVGALVVTDRTGWPLGIALVVGTVVVAGYVNAFNFMDGINGISGSQAAIGGAFLAVLANDAGQSALGVSALALTGASVAFLPFNAPVARTFLGDVGSYFIGFWLAFSAFALVDAGVSPAVVVAPFLLYLADTSTTLVRRARRGEPLMVAHRDHTYQRLTRHGWGHVAVASLCAVMSASCSVIMLLASDSNSGWQIFGLGTCLVLVAGYLVLPGAIARSRGDGREIA